MSDEQNFECPWRATGFGLGGCNAGACAGTGAVLCIGVCDVYRVWLAQRQEIARLKRQVAESDDLLTVAHMHGHQMAVEEWRGIVKAKDAEIKMLREALRGVKP